MVTTRPPCFSITIFDTKKTLSTLFILLQLLKKLKKLIYMFLKAQMFALIMVMWPNMVEETGEPGENQRTLMVDHYPVMCPDADLNPDSRGDKRVCYPLSRLP